jgi:hypothetical protein
VCVAGTRGGAAEGLGVGGESGGSGEEDAGEGEREGCFCFHGSTVGIRWKG